jgi:hypothetical protein
MTGTRMLSIFRVRPRKVELLVPMCAKNSQVGTVKCFIENKNSILFLIKVKNFTY